jgi:segregation and condensation protein B
MEYRFLKSVVEGILFSIGDPVSVDALSAALHGTSRDSIQRALDELEEEYRIRARGFVLSKVAGGYQFRTLPEAASWVLEMKRARPARLSRAALETLSIIAYNQPVTKARIEQIRGVESSATIKSLLERDLVLVIGRKEIPGRPLVYGTSKRFLETLGLPDISALPPLPDIEDIP